MQSGQVQENLKQFDQLSLGPLPSLNSRQPTETMVQLAWFGNLHRRLGLANVLHSRMSTTCMDYIDILEVILGEHWRFLTGVLMDGVILDIMDHHFMWRFTCVPNFSSLVCLKVCHEPPVIEDTLGGHWRFLTGFLEDGVIFDIMIHHYMGLFTSVPSFSSLAWIEVCQEPTVLEVILGGCWWFLTGDLEEGVILDFIWLRYWGVLPG